MITSCTAFLGFRRIATGPILDVALAAHDAVREAPDQPLLIFSDEDARPVEIDLRGSAEEVAARLTVATPPSKPAGPGRPKLGVTAREVTLMPRHWEWLAAQPGGASVALRKLVEQARKADDAPARARQSQDAAYRFMSAMSGNEPGFEEASRALFGGNRAHFDALVEPWPADVRDHLRRLAFPVFEAI